MCSVSVGQSDLHVAKRAGEKAAAQHARAAEVEQSDWLARSEGSGAKIQQNKLGDATLPALFVCVSTASHMAGGASADPDHPGQTRWGGLGTTRRGSLGFG